MGRGCLWPEFRDPLAPQSRRANQRERLEPSGYRVHVDRSGIFERRCLPELIYFSAEDATWAGSVAGQGGEKKEGKRVALAPGARWVSIMLNRKWSPAIECLSAPPPEAHKAARIRLLRCNVTEKLNSLVLCDRLRLRLALSFVSCLSAATACYRLFQGLLQHSQKDFGRKRN